MIGTAEETENVLWHMYQQEMQNKQYYVGLLDEIAQVFGEDAYVDDAGGKHDSPLRAKMPALVRTLMKEMKELRQTVLEGEQANPDWRSFWKD